MPLQVLPARADNSYQGRRFALWLLGGLTALYGAMGLNSIFNAATVATSADGIPLDAFPADAAETVVALFALLGLSRVFLCVLAALVLWRYRSLVPLLLSLLLLEHLSRRAVLLLLPIPRPGTPPASGISLAVLIVLVAGLVGSLWPRAAHEPSDSTVTGHPDG